MPVRPTSNSRYSIHGAYQTRKATREAFGLALAQLGETHADVVVVDGDVGNSTRTEIFARSFPRVSSTLALPRPNLVGVAAGLASSGKRAWLSSFATFVMCNAYDQLRMSVAFPCLDVKVVGTHAGISIGEDGPSQMGIEDYGLACSLPNFTVVVPADEPRCSRPSRRSAPSRRPPTCRAGRPNVPIIYESKCELPARQSNEVRAGNDLTIIACGLMVAPALQAADELAKQGTHARVLGHAYDQADDDERRRFEKPAERNTGRLVVARSISCMAGSAARSPCRRPGSIQCRCASRHQRYFLRNRGSRRKLLAKYGLTAADIVKAALALPAKK